VLRIGKWTIVGSSSVGRPFRADETAWKGRPTTRIDSPILSASVTGAKGEGRKRARAAASRLGFAAGLGDQLVDFGLELLRIDLGLLEEFAEGIELGAGQQVAERRQIVAPASVRG